MSIDIKYIPTTITNKYSRFDLVRVYETDELRIKKYNSMGSYLGTSVKNNITYYSKDYGIISLIYNAINSKRDDIIFYMLNYNDDKSDYLWKKFLMSITPFHFCDGNKTIETSQGYAYDDLIRCVDISDDNDRCPLCGKRFKDIEIFPAFKYLYQWINIKNQSNKEFPIKRENGIKYNYYTPSSRSNVHWFIDSNYSFESIDKSSINREYRCYKLHYNVDSFMSDLNKCINLILMRCNANKSYYDIDDVNNLEYDFVETLKQDGKIIPKSLPKYALLEEYSKGLYFFNKKKLLLDFKDHHKSSNDNSLFVEKSTTNKLSSGWYPAKVYTEKNSISKDINDRLDVYEWMNEDKKISFNNNYFIQINSINSHANGMICKYDPKVEYYGKKADISIYSIRKSKNLEKLNFLVNKIKTCKDINDILTHSHLSNESCQINIYCKIFNNDSIMFKFERSNILLKDNYLYDGSDVFTLYNNVHHYGSINNNFIISNVHQELSKKYNNFKEFYMRLVESNLEHKCFNCGKEVASIYLKCRSCGYGSVIDTIESSKIKCYNHLLSTENLNDDINNKESIFFIEQNY